MIGARWVVNSLSLSRIGLGLLFVVCFQRKAGLYYFSAILWGISLTTDLLDGYLARRWRVASLYGRFWDSLGDKSFYAAVIIAFNAQGFLNPVISWALITREVGLYVTRILFSEKIPKIEQIRPWTNGHGYFMHLTLILGLMRMYSDIHRLSFPIHGFIQLSALTALILGVVSIFKFLKLEEPSRSSANT
ncbi:MAG TPA: CDP-alcohol phosphatidyltransferase family protein [Pyrinomonadaceae bacterium]|nr:CDP-alcohol phosphatidyltransferase family protein [Pyrinomonadaceae bacterium]